MLSHTLSILALLLTKTKCTEWGQPPGRSSSVPPPKSRLLTPPINRVSPNDRSPFTDRTGATAYTVESAGCINDHLEYSKDPYLADKFRNIEPLLLQMEATIITLGSDSELIYGHPTLNLLQSLFDLNAQRRRVLFINIIDKDSDQAVDLRLKGYKGLILLQDFQRSYLIPFPCDSAQLANYKINHKFVNSVGIRMEAVCMDVNGHRDESQDAVIDKLWSSVAFNPLQPDQSRIEIMVEAREENLYKFYFDGKVSIFPASQYELHLIEFDLKKASE